MAPEIQLQASKVPGEVGSSGRNVTAGGDPEMEKPLPHDSFKIANRLTLVPLIFVIYFEVAGGPYGCEPAVQAAGALYALLGFLIFPFIWSVPESLVTAELATAIPGNGGFVLWAERAFGPFCGSLLGSWKFLCGVINSAAFPSLCVDYLSRVAPSLEDGGPRKGAVVGMNILLSFLNYTGLAVVGYTAVALGLASLMPFVLMTAIAMPKLKPARWLVRGRNNDWRLYFNTLFWNLNFWDSVSTMAGEVDRPEKTFPKALLVSGLMASLGYLLPLMAGTGALDAAQDAWGNGFFADVAGMIAGHWLKIWIEVGAVLSAIGLYEAQLSASAFQLLGMADLGLLPRVYASRAKWFNTPWVGILTSSLITLATSFMTFSDIVASANFVYGLSMLMEFAAFIWLRRKEPALKRPFRVPLRLPGLLLLCLVPTVFLVYVMVIASWKVFAISGGMTVLAVAMYHLMAFFKSRAWMEFNNVVNVDHEEGHGNISGQAVTGSRP